MDQDLLNYLSQKELGYNTMTYRFLSTKQKQEMLPELIEMQEGFVCFYCGQTLLKTNWIYEHLDNDKQHNIIENIRLAHQACNIKKIKDSDYQILAKDELDKQSQMSLSERKSEVKDTEMSEIEINVYCRNYTDKFITERVQTDGSILYHDALWTIVNDCNKKIGHGSEQSIRRHINALTSLSGKFKIIKNDSGKREIVRRTEN